jgi:alcohol dehydrogenase (NADP+)
MIKARGYGAIRGDKTLRPMVIERAPPKPNELLIDVLYCGVCHSDVHIIDDDWGYTLYPLMPGHEAVGRVLSAGSSVTRFKPET